jgi:predicted CoA-substrate-specific enzyme activase
MSVRLGIDIGAVSLKVALVLPPEQAERVLAEKRASSLLRRLAAPAERELAILVALPRRTRGRPHQATGALLGELLDVLGPISVTHAAVTGSGGELVTTTLGASTCNEFQACARATDFLHRRTRSVFEIGGEASRYLRLEPDPLTGALAIRDYGMNGDCAAGTGGFLDQQASRLKFRVEEIGNTVGEARRAAQIAGRCSVFAKSDMIHAQQKGFAPAEVLRGLCNAVAENFKTAVVRGRKPEPPIAFVGGVAANRAVVAGLREAFALAEDDLFVPEAAECFGAVGAALLAEESGDLGHSALTERLARLHRAAQQRPRFATWAPLSLEHVTLLRDRIRPYRRPASEKAVDAYLGIDVGSVGTKLVALDEQGHVIHDIFTRTEGRPIAVVARCLRELEQAIGGWTRIRAVGTTGSGRELIGELVGADSINDEITAHKTGATLIGDRLLGRRPDTIFEIGGQDSKFIRLEAEGNGSAETVVVDFTMNEACAAGTGSFLEERAEELGVAIEDEFAALALSSRAPLRLGERCTVFMERDVNSALQRGAKREDIIAGLAYSVVQNYLNRVVRGRSLGSCIFFQGGTAYNDAVAAAFTALCGQQIIVPPHNAVLGAIGAALLARDRVAGTGRATRFRGFDLDRIEYELREFTCKGCGNRCAIQEFTVEGEKTYWGDKCSERFRKRAKVDREPTVPDLVELRRELLLADGEDGGSGDEPGNGDEPGVTIGIPLAMYAFDYLPLWRGFFRECGFRVLLSGETNREIVRRAHDSVVAEPCFPIMVAHGHVASLAEQGADYIWLPNLLNAPTRFPERESHVCPWGQTLPYVVRQAPSFRELRERILCPTLRLREGSQELRERLVETVRPLGTKRSVAERALEIAQQAQRRFEETYRRAGREALAALVESGEPGLVIVGRPYNIHDPGVSLSVARKLRDLYGANVLPIDALELDDVDIGDVHDNMYWEYGRKILAAGKIVARHPNLHIIYVTNFKCGPDSFIKSYLRGITQRPFLTLQFDGHSNDAGMMTRCEAYLDSKGILRWWRTRRETAAATSEVERSTSPSSPTPLPV